MNKFAFIVGINDYGNKSDNLNNAINDAKLIAEILEYKGFDIKLVFDVDHTNFINHFNVFLDTISNHDTVIFFFAGHGIEDRDINYMIPSKLTSKDELIPLDTIQNQLYNNNHDGIKIIIFDACRNNAVGVKTTSIPKIKSLYNTLISFSTSSTNTANDGKKNSPFTKNLVETLSLYNLNINEIFSKTREKVINETYFKQIPWEYNSLINKDINFDNISVPNIYSESFQNFKKSFYSSIFTRNRFIFAGTSKYVNFIKKDLDINSFRLDEEEKEYSIEEIDSNDNYIVFLNNLKELIIMNKEWEISTYTFNEIDNFPFTVSINMDNTVLIGGYSKNIFLWNIISNEKKSIPVEGNIYSSTSKQNLFAFGGEKGIFKVYDILNNKYKFESTSKEFLITYCIKFSDDNKYIATSHNGGKIIIWSTLTYEIIYIHRLEENLFIPFPETTNKVSNNVKHVEFSKDSSFLMIGSDNGKITFLDLKYFTVIDEIKLELGNHTIDTFSTNEDDSILLVSINNKIHIFKR